MKISKVCIIIGVLVAVMLLFSTLTCAAMGAISVLLNGEKLEFNVPAQIIDGRVMVPVRGIFEALGAEIEWDNNAKTVTANKNTIVIIMQINNTYMYVNDKIIELDVPPQLINERTLVPLRAVAEGLNANVDWDADNMAVIITTNQKVGGALKSRRLYHSIFQVKDGHFDCLNMVR